MNVGVPAGKLPGFGVGFVNRPSAEGVATNPPVGIGVAVALGLPNRVPPVTPVD